ncbi:MAG TPA: ABC transporter ATP-binding protein [bacterium]|nr:ABC transporter ATP-binding protein [bacterium]
MRELREMQPIQETPLGVPGLVLEGLRVERGGRPILSGLDLRLPAKAYTCVLGASGSGKTTLLSAVAGTLRPTGGRVEILGETMSDAAQRGFVEPEKRRLGMVFQDYLLWPHLTVAGNIALPLGFRQGNRRAAEMAGKWLSWVGLEKLESRYPSELSGGQQQRVALARALAVEPRLLLLDEPLSALDAATRVELRKLLRRLTGQLGFGALHVTHDAAEALSLADRLVLMDRGRVLQVGTPEEVFMKPATAQAARLTGPVSLVPAPVLSRQGEAAVVQLGGMRLSVACEGEVAAGKEALLVLRAQALSHLPEPLAIKLQASLVDALFVGHEWHVDATILPGAHIAFRSDRRPQAKFDVYLRPELARVVPPEADPHEKQK